MSLSALIDTHDESALAALASVGLVRRATRDLGNGKAKVTSRDDAVALVTADGQTVELKGATLNDATCPCPATGICRHIILAVLALRADAPAEDVPRTEEPQQSARDDLTALTEDSLRKFAGADWDKALIQARVSGDGTFTEDGPNLSVRLPDTEMPVTFLAGLGLKGAVFKGPKTTKRRVVAAAALLVRMQTGTQKLEDLSVDNDETEPLAAAFLQAVKPAVEDLVAGVFGGGSVIAEEAIFDMAISARAQAAPRLTGLLRVLARQARLAREHHFSYSDAPFLSLAATTYALAHALEAAPQDPTLTGVLRRTYTDQPDMTLLPLGAVKWTAATGARGMRVHLWSPDDKQWHTTGQARGAGMDPSFTPQAAYNAPLWLAGPASALIGTTLRLTSGRGTSDRQFAMDHGRADIDDTAPDPIDTVEDTGALFSDFTAARDDLIARMPAGLHQAGISVPIMLRPTSFGEASFDDIAQIYRIPVTGSCGTSLDLILSNEVDTKWLLSQSSRLRGILCEAGFVDLELRICPVSIHLPRGKDKAPNVCNLTLDPEHSRASAGALGVGGRAISFLKNALSATPTIGHNPIHDLTLQALDTVAETLRFGDTEALDKLLKTAETLGLKTLHQALTAFSKTGDTQSGLRVAYIAAELARTSTLRS